ncbi:MAG: FAD-dependent oxidoreductase [Acidiferrobacterales bacterium]
MKSGKFLVTVMIATMVYVFFAFHFGRYFSIENLKTQQQIIDAYYRHHPVQTVLAFFVTYVAFVGLTLPGAIIMSVASGAIFGLTWGTIIVSFASSLGATLAFLTSRFLLRDLIQKRFGKNLCRINEGMQREGAYYLLALRLVPVLPFSLINVTMGLTSMRTSTFYFISQIGMLAGTLIYVNAGTHIARITDLRSVLSPGLIVSLAILGIFPLLSRRLVVVIRGRRLLRGHARPRKFDRNLVVIGAGSAGLVAAYIAAAVRARVTLIEKYEMGGDCLHTGCVPSKALIRSARFLAQLRRAPEFGIKTASADFDFADIMERVQRVVSTVEPHDSVTRYTALGVECIHGNARITSPYTVSVDGRTLSTRSIVIATGASPNVPRIPGIERTDYLTSDTVWRLRRLPRRLLVLGGGPAGCELSQCFARFGSKVTQIETNSRVMAREDPEVSALVMQHLIADGVDVRLAHEAQEFCIEDERKVLACVHAGRRVEFEFDEILVVAGRTANACGYGLEELGIPVTPQGTIETNDYLQTVYPNIYVCGDAAGPFQFTHTAAHQAWYATVNALFGNLRKFKANYAAIPWSTFTDPEVARVGLNEQEARERGIAYEVTTYGLDELDRAIIDGETLGYVKVLTVPGKDRILGATFVGTHAGDLIAEFVLALNHGLGLNKILSTIHVYPTLGEANRHIAGAWRRAHAPKRLLRWAGRYHSWRRG